MSISGPRDAGRTRDATPLTRLLSVVAASIPIRRRDPRPRATLPSEVAAPTRLDSVLREPPGARVAASDAASAPHLVPGVGVPGLVPPPPGDVPNPGLPAVGDGRAPEIVRRVPDFPETPPPERAGGDPVVGRGSGARGSAAVRIDLSDGRRITIRGTALLGRAPVPEPTEDVAQLITVRDPALSVSKTHVALVVDDGGAWVVDRGSTNGTVVTLPDGQQVICVPGHRVRVRTGARVLIGDVELVVSAAG